MPRTCEPILRYVLVVGGGAGDTKVSFWFQERAWPSPSYVKETVLISSCDACPSRSSQPSMVGSDHNTLISILNPLFYFIFFPAFRFPVTHPSHNFSMQLNLLFLSYLPKLLAWVSDVLIQLSTHSKLRGLLRVWAVECISLFRASHQSCVSRR